MIIEKNKHYKFECIYNTINGQINVNAIIQPFEKNGQSLEEYFKTGQNHKYDLMCYTDAYDKEHVTMPSYASSDGRIPMPSTSYKKSLYSLGHKIKFLDNWLQWFDDNYQNIISIYKSKMSKLIETIPKLPPKKRSLL